MLTENEYGWQTIRKNTKRLNIWRDLHYEGIGDFYVHPNLIKSSSCIYTIPNESSVITIQTLTTDDGHSYNRLVSNDGVIFAIQYTTRSNDNYTKQIYLDYLNNNNRYKIIDGQGVKNVFEINTGYYLSNIPNYKDIRVFTVWLAQGRGIIKQNEASVMVNYTQDIF